MRLDIMVTVEPDAGYGAETILRNGVSVSVPGTEGARAGSLTAAQVEALRAAASRRLDQVRADVMMTLGALKAAARSREEAEAPSA